MTAGTCESPSAGSSAFARSLPDVHACGRNAVYKKRLRMTAPPSKRDPAYWRRRLFKNAFTYKGKRVKVVAWSVKIQLYGKRKAFTLVSTNRAQAAGEACQIYQTILDQGWEAVIANVPGQTHRILNASHPAPASPSSIAHDPEYWKSRLIQRKYPELPDSRAGEFSIRIEHARRGQFFPLGTSDENQAARRALAIYQTVLNRGWAEANAGFARELAVGFRWQDNPLAWTYTTIHTRPGVPPPPPVSTPNSSCDAISVAVIEPDPGIRTALIEAITAQAGFCYCAAAGSPVKAWSTLSQRRASLVVANHSSPDDAYQAQLDKLRESDPALPVLTYSVFEDSDQLFKSTPGGSVAYLLKRTSPERCFEPIASLTGRPTRELIAANVRKYFNQISGLLPSGHADPELARLTPRELEILECLSRGDLLKEAAGKLGISTWTVQGHVKSIFEKLRVHSRTEAVVKFLQK